MLELIFSKDTLIESSLEKVEVVAEKLVIVTLEELINETANNEIISFYGIVVRIGEYEQRTSRAGNNYAIREVTIIDDSCDCQLICTLWGDQALNYVEKANEAVLVKQGKVSIGLTGEKKVSISRFASIVHGLKDRRTDELLNWMQEQLNFEAGIDTPILSACNND